MPCIEGKEDTRCVRNNNNNNQDMFMSTWPCGDRQYEQLTVRLDWLYTREIDEEVRIFRVYTTTTLQSYYKQLTNKLDS